MRSGTPNWAAEAVLEDGEAAVLDEVREDDGQGAATNDNGSLAGAAQHAPEANLVVHVSLIKSIHECYAIR